jgi:hypothetical protein
MNQFALVRRFLIAVSLLIAAVLSPAARADSFRAPYPHAVTSANGRYVFKMVPSREEAFVHEESPPGAGIAYRVNADGELTEIWKTSGWYSRDIFLGSDGATLVRLGASMSGDGPSRDHVGVAFYREGKLLKSYSTAELIKDRTKVSVTASHYEWLPGLAGFAPGHLGAEDAPTLHDAASRFSLTTIDDRRYHFDVTTGEIAEVEIIDRTKGKWAAADDLDRLAIALALTDFPVSRDRLKELVGLPEKMSPIYTSVGDDLMTEVSAITDPLEAPGYFALRETVQLPSGKSPVAENLVRAELIFEATNGSVFVIDPERFSPAVRNRMKAEMKARNQTPQEYSEQAASQVPKMKMIRLH